MHTYGFKPGMKRSAVIRTYGTSEVRIRGLIRTIELVI